MEPVSFLLLIMLNPLTLDAPSGIGTIKLVLNVLSIGYKTQMDSALLSKKIAELMMLKAFALAATKAMQW